MLAPGLTLAFDLDGTLVDTAPDLVHAANHVLTAAGLAPVDAAHLVPEVSFGARRMIERGLEINRATRTESTVDEILDRFLAYYEANIAVASRPFPGVVDVLDRAAGAGVRLAVCTNKREHLSRKLLDQLGLLDRFATICGRDTFEVCKPHPDHLTRAIALADGRPEHAVMIGDSDTDLRTARAAGIPMVGVTFGYTEVPMAELGPDALIDSYAELEGALRRLLARS